MLDSCCSKIFFKCQIHSPRATRQIRVGYSRDCFCTFVWWISTTPPADGVTKYPSGFTRFCRYDSFFRSLFFLTTSCKASDFGNFHSIQCSVFLQSSFVLNSSCLSMKFPTPCFASRSALFSCLFSVILLSPALKVTCSTSTYGGLTVVFAEAAARSIDARGSFQNRSRKDDNDIKTCPSSGTIATVWDEKSRNANTKHSDEIGEDNTQASCKSSSPSLCLRPLTARSGIYLKTLYHHNREKVTDSVDTKRDSDENSFDVCWQSMQDESKTHLESKVASSRLLDRQKSLALKVDLLFATSKIQNKEIQLPKSISGLLRDEKGMLAINLRDEGRSPSPSYLPASIELLSRDAARVDLSGRWRPSKDISSQDLRDYDKFLTACCSDQISYWTRQLLSSYSIVSRQEFVVNQIDDGRRLEFVDIHPLAPGVWNRTIVTSDRPEHSNASTIEKRIVNRLKGPQGDPVLVEAYWEEDGTVHTSLLRKVVDDQDEMENADNQGWLQTRRYLSPGPDSLETQSNKDEDKPVMVVETTYHSTSYPTQEAQWGDDASSTKMVWRWEQVDGSSS